MNTLSGTIADLDRQGFSHHFQVVGQRVRTLDGGGGFGADQVLIREWHRFEGVSDPDDMAIVYALESVNGPCGRAREQSTSASGRRAGTSPSG